MYKKIIKLFWKVSNVIDAIPVSCKHPISGCDVYKMGNFAILKSYVFYYIYYLPDDVAIAEFNDDDSCYFIEFSFHRSTSNIKYMFEKQNDDFLLEYRDTDNYSRIIHSITPEQIIRTDDDWFNFDVLYGIMDFRKVFEDLKELDFKYNACFYDLYGFDYDSVLNSFYNELEIYARDNGILL